MELTFNNVLHTMKPSASMAKGLQENGEVYNLAIGSPDIAPPKNVEELVTRFSHSPNFNYQPTKGSLKALSNLKNVVDPYNDQLNPSENIILVPGAKYGIYLALKSICNIGEEVLLIEPYWLSYPDICTSLQLQFSFWKEDIQVDKYHVEAFSQIVSAGNFKAVIVNNPINPSGYVFSNEEMKEMIKICAKKNVWILIDEVYKDLCFDSKANLHTSISGDNVIRVGSLSKSLSIPGFRAGYVLGSALFISKFNLLHQHIATSIHSLTNFIVGEIDVASYIKYTRLCATKYAERFLFAKTLLTKKGFKVIESHASFYLLMDVSSKFENGEAACDYYEKMNILMTPGIHYGLSSQSFVRICLTHPIDKLSTIFELL